MSAGERIGVEDLVGGRRLRMLETIRARPGIEFTALAAECGMAHGSLQYHLSVLARVGKVASEKVGRFRRFFEVGAVPLAARNGAALGMNDVPRRILESLGRAECATQQDLAAAFGLTRQAVAYHLRQCVDRGLVEVERVGRLHRYRGRSPAPAHMPPANQTPTGPLRLSPLPSNTRYDAQAFSCPPGSRAACSAHF